MGTRLIRPFRADLFFSLYPQGVTLGYSNSPPLGLCKRWDTPDYLEINEQVRQIVIQIVKSGKSDAEEFSGNGKWAQVAERLGKGNLLDREAGKTLRKASQEFRDNFRFREPPDFEHIENDR
ncbi:MAG: hypothetical protein GY749_41625 [Desulfobacteraceae bacterium]|nr:hypothetical protein [Desulfobacteraceae bacterium]